MTSLERIGNNIRYLREAYGESQEQLGFMINVAKATISAYENGTREAKKEKLQAIATHFSVPVEELMNGDFSDLPKLVYDPNTMFENIDLWFPYCASKTALANEHFKRAYKYHKDVFEGIKKQSLDDFEHIEICFDEYGAAIEATESQEEAAANMVCLLYLMMFFFKTVPYLYKTEPAALELAKTSSPKAKRIIENTDPSFVTDAEKIAHDFFTPECEQEINELLTMLKDTGKWSDLAYYYLAMKYFWGFVDNSFSIEYNRRIGAEMLRALGSIGNTFASNFEIR